MRSYPFALFLSSLALAAACLGPVGAAAADATALRARHEQLRGPLQNNPFGRELHIDSAEQGDTLRGDVYAVLDHPFATVRDALKDPAQWCAILILPFNTKYCQAVDSERGTVLAVRIGRKYNQPVEDAYRLNFVWRGAAATGDYLESRVLADEGPLGTRDYRISVAAVPLEGNRSFLHLSYSYSVGITGRLAMQAYLATAGADKVGFTQVGRDAQGQPRLIGGVRGAVERNAMRYYLAVDAYLDSLAAPPAQQVERRIQAWFNATERHPRQLREMDRATYVGMKRLETERQRTLIQ